jgi:hypothetical protein
MTTGLILASTAFAGTYKWTDEKGNVHYTQQPPAEGTYERMKVDKTRAGSAEPEAAPEQNANTSKPATSNQTVKDEVAKNAEIRAKNCEGAKKNLEILTVYKRYKDKDGNVVRMDDSERNRQIEETKQQIADFCD